MENRTPLKELPLINGKEYRVRVAEDGRPMITYGGSGILYFVLDENKRRMVIKELFPRNCAYRKADGSVDAVPGQRDVFEHYQEAFRQEANRLCTAATATHHVKGDFESFDGRFAVMREMPEDTQSLMELIPQRQNIRNEENILWAISATKRILEAVGKLHDEEGILHLDLSLGNIFVSNDKSGPEGYVLDFGSCLDLQGAHSCSMQNLSFRPSGSAQFAAPELENGTFSELTPSADLFSIGLIFFHLLCSHRGFYANKDVHKADVLVGNHRYIERALDSLNLSPAEEKTIFDFILSAIEYLPENRFQTAASMLEAVEEMERTILRKGVSRYSLWSGSIAYYQKLWKDDAYDPDLFVEAVGCEIVDHQCVFDADNRRLHWEHKAEKMLEIMKNNNCLLISEGGSGKTTYLYRLWGQLLVDTLMERENAPIPVFVRLDEYKNLSDQEHYVLDKVLENYFAEGIEKNTTTRRLLLDTLTSGAVLILDGYNEAINPTGLDKQIVSLINAGVKIVISSRYDMQREWLQSFVRAQMEKIPHEIVLKKLKQHGRYLPHYRILELLNIPQYLTAYLNVDSDKKIYTEGMLILENMRKMVKKAELLGHNNEVAYREYGIEEAFPLIASKNRGMAFEYKEAHEILRKAPWTKRRAALNCNHDICLSVLEAMLHCGILQQVGTDTYRFAHQSYQETLLALQQANEIKAQIVPEELKTDVNDSIYEYAPAKVSLLSDILEERAAWLNKKPSHVMSLLSTLKNCHEAAEKLAISNLIHILMIARDYDLSNLCFDRLDLSFVDFRCCNLSGSSFRYATISAESISSIGHKTSLKNMIVLPKTGYIATYCADEPDILLWTSSGKYVRKISPKIDGMMGAVTSVAASPNGKLLALLGPNGVTVIDVDSGRIKAIIERERLEGCAQQIINCYKRVAGMEVPKNLSDSANTINFISFYGNKRLLVSCALVAFYVNLKGVPKGFGGIFMEKELAGKIKSLAVSTDKKWLYCATEECIGKTKAYTRIPRFPEVINRVDCGPSEQMSISPDGKTFLLRADRFRSKSNHSRVEDHFYNDRFEEIPIPGEFTGCLSNNYIAKKGMAGVYWRNSKQENAKIHYVRVVGADNCVFSNDETELYIATNNCEVFVYSTDKGALLRVFRVGGTERGTTVYDYVNRTAKPGNIQALDDGYVARRISRKVGHAVIIHNLCEGNRAIPFARNVLFSSCCGEYYLMETTEHDLEIYSLRDGSRAACVRGQGVYTALVSDHGFWLSLYRWVYYLPEKRKMITVTTDEVSRIWDFETNSWIPLVIQGAPSYVNHAYPMELFGQPGCTVVDDKVVVVNVDHHLLIWDMLGQLCYTAKIDACGLKKLLPVPGTSIVLLVFLKKSGVTVRIFDTEQLCFWENIYPEVRISAVLYGAFREGNIISVRKLDDPMQRKEAAWFGEENVEFLESSDGLIAVVKNGCVSENHVAILAEDGSLVLYTRDGQRCYQTPQMVWKEDLPISISISLDGDHIAVGLRDGTVRVFSRSNGSVTTLPGIDAYVAGADFRSADMDEILKDRLCASGAIV